MASFNYKNVYYNQTLDCHPPLFYYAIHTICSFFPASFSKWYGFSLNIIIFILVQILLFILSKKIFDSDKNALLTCFIYGFSSFLLFSSILYPYGAICPLPRETNIRQSLYYKQILKIKHNLSFSVPLYINFSFRLFSHLLFIKKMLYCIRGIIFIHHNNSLRQYPFGLHAREYPDHEQKSTERCCITGCDRAGCR